jgi:phosphoribosylformylglycinamidine synthase
VDVAVVTFPGSNCDEDTIHVAEEILGARTTRVWHEDRALPAGTDLVVLPGGFSYGDALRAGALARFSPIMDAIVAHADRGGWVLGICNGFQVLLEAGLLPGAVLQNASRKFVCRVVTLAVQTSDTPYTRDIDRGARLRMPVAHHQGRYFADPETLNELKTRDQIVFKYEGGNPNGSLEGIAGIVNERRNILGLMPHPERASESVLGSTDGLALFRSIARYVAEANR